MNTTGVVPVIVCVSQRCLMVEVHSIKDWRAFNDDGWSWTNQFGYPQDQYYTDANTQLDEVFGEGPDHIKAFAEQKFSKWFISMIRQRPGQCIPVHVDKHFKFRQEHGDHAGLVRYCIFLEDWQPGHYLEYDSQPLTQWRAGDYIKIWPDVPHRSANMGSTTKYTCQITGIEQ